MGGTEQKILTVTDEVKSFPLSRYLTFKVSYLLMAIFFAGMLSGVYYYTSSNKFVVHTSVSKTTILELVTAFVSTYSEQRAQNKNTHLPVPAAFRALSLKSFEQNKSLNDAMDIELFGRSGLAIKQNPKDEHISSLLGRMAQKTNPKIWSGYIGDYGREVLRTIKPVVALKQSCVDCHNRLQTGIKKWTLGELMGAYVIDAPASSFFRKLRWETGMLAIVVFLFVWGSIALLMRQQLHLSLANTRVLRESEKGTMLAAARKQAENEATKLSAQVRKAYEDLRQALEKERQLNALQRQFVSMASHEFRTPLAIIDGAAQRLERRSGASDSAEIKRRAHKIRNAVERMTQVMESTLTAASLEVGELTIKIESCDFPRLLRDACQRQRELSTNHRITCDIVTLPETIKADPASLEQIFSNLLSNAIKYSPDAPDIEVKAYLDGNDVVFYVRDYGLGIDKEDMPRVFERFFRARTATGIAGTGIGLNLIKTLIELHDGSIVIASETGIGSTFTVRLPIDGPEEITKKGCQAA